jgi:glycosyltransferase involved in cell wall biosynthesis
MRALRDTGVLRIVEVVNSHVAFQDDLLAEEYQRCGLHYKAIFAPEKKRRLAEYEEADFILCPSEFARRSFLARGFSADRLLKNVYGFKKPGVGIGSREARTGFQILYVGSIHVRKGLRYLVDAFCRLRTPGKQLKLVGPLTAATGLENTSLPEGITFTGPLKGEALADAYAQADVFVLPSIEDGFGLVMAEALAYGVPVIATDHTGAEDLFTEGKEGYVVPSGDVGSIVDRLELLAADRQLRERMSLDARNRANELGGWDICGENLVRLLRSLKAI